MMSGNTALPRKNYIDNIRSATIVLVLIYHVVYIFNSVGVVSNIPVQGIPALDSICYFLYPWFMCLLFVVAGISARYSLQTRSTRQFARERVQKLIVPYLGGAVLLGWLNGWVTAHYVDMFGGHAVPGFVKYLVYCLNIGPLWFLLELFVISMILLLILRIDRRDRLWALAGKTGLPLIILLVLAVWGSSFLLNPPVVVVFRNGIYWLMFLLGYYVFSHDTVLAKLKQHAILFFIIAVGLGVVEVWYFFGQNYTSDACLQHPLTNLYLWMMILAVLGCAQRWLDFSNSLTKYLQKRSFALYVFHYPLLVTAAYLITTYTELPMAAVYLVLLPFTFAAPILFYEITSRIPVIRYLLLGK
ncbi:hypothetical protein Desru_1413 [Desulforamulus ruminis DSM 2154]|uniref:Acyltransferase 3 domain-containing protein n=2 Tax=Desulforamulus ruminis TaxID=1564 RepID=F6DQA7_DESRL|nr:acyltransferase family protein [Desulforamulus ruminis]AEG59685.1 hypothetical protein Desru_1413 [Desulforamulus ruminis DSM 2154]